MKKSAILGMLAVACAVLFGQSAALQNAGVKPEDAAGAAVEPADPEKISGIGIFARDYIFKHVALYSEGKPLATPKAPVPREINGRLFYIASKSEPHEWICLRAGEILAAVPAGDGGGIESLRAAGFSKKSDFELKGGGAFALMAKRAERGEKFATPPGAVVAGFSARKAPAAPAGELLYNSVRLPEKWPPDFSFKSDEPAKIPYLENPPKTIRIDVGRQLFVDDFLVEKTRGIKREFHYPRKYAGNPILKPETDLERRGNPVAAPLSGSILWNPDKRIFEMWYEAGHLRNLAYAYSKDGLKWERPDIKGGTNKILDRNPDSWTVVRDWRETDPSKKFKMFFRTPDGKRDFRAEAYVSADGVNWKFAGFGGYCGDRSTLIYNPFRDKWIYSLRWGGAGGRVRAYLEADDFLEGMKWAPTDPVAWARADRLDRHDDGEFVRMNQLYNLDAVAYESIMLGFFQIMYGEQNDVYADRGEPKCTGLNFAYSRDGFHWHRPDRTLAIDGTRGETWDKGYVQSISNICLVMGDRLYIYYTGFAGDKSKAKDKLPKGRRPTGLYANGATGVAFLRRDGFVSLNSESGGAGEILTRPLVFSGKYLFVNADAPNGGVKAELRDAAGKPIEPFTFENCEGVSADSTAAKMKWRNSGGSDLTKLANIPTRIAFKIDGGKLYSFWVSRDESGRSDGYVAGGGYGFTCDTDTIGIKSVEAARRAEGGK